MTKPDHDKAETAITAMDLLLYLVMVCLVIAAIAMVRMNKSDAAHAVDMEVEPNIEMTWPDGNFGDLDFWLIMLSDGRVSFDNKDLGFSTLDSDDDGTRGYAWPAALPESFEYMTHRPIVVDQHKR